MCHLFGQILYILFNDLFCSVLTITVRQGLSLYINTFDTLNQVINLPSTQNNNKMFLILK